MKRLILPLVAAVLAVTLAPVPAHALGARIRAMGGAGLALADDENTVFLNAAGMSQLDRTMAQIGGQVVDRQNWQSDHAAFVSKIYQSRETKAMTLEQYLESDYEFRAQPERVSNWSYGIGFLHERRSAQLSRDFGRDPIEEEQTGLNLAFATRFPVAERLTRRPELYAGFSINLMDHTWENSSLGVSGSRDLVDLDLSFLYKANNRFNLAAILESVISETSGTTAGAGSNSTSLNLGGAYTFGEKRDTVVALDFLNVLNAGSDNGGRWKFGVERQFLDNDFALRMGSWDGTLTLGFGLRFFDDFKMDYAYQNGSVVKEHHVSVRIPF